MSLTIQDYSKAALKTVLNGVNMTELKKIGSARGATNVILRKKPDLVDFIVNVALGQVNL